MKTILFALAIALTFGFHSSQKSNSVSFTMQMENVKHPDMVTASQCYMKGSKLLTITNMTIHTGKEIKVKMLFDGDEQAMFSIDDEAKTATKRTFTGAAEETKTDKPQITVTNEYKTIDGYKCRKTNITQEKISSEFWTTNSTINCRGYNECIHNVDSITIRKAKKRNYKPCKICE